MIGEQENVPQSWRWGFTLGDQFIINALDDDVRAVVERYVRKYTPEAAVAGEPVVSMEDAYREGFEDGVEEAASAASSAAFCHLPKKYAKVAK